MKRKMKRMLSAALAFSMMLTMTVVSFAEEAKPSLKDTVSYTYTDESFSIKLVEGKAFHNADRIGILVLKPGYDFRTAIDSGELQTATFDTKQYMGYEIEDTLMEHTFKDGSTTGKYAIRITKTAYDGKVESLTFVYSNLPGTQNETLKKEFTTVDETGFATLFDKYKDVAFDYSEYPNFETDLKAAATEFVQIRNGVLKKSETAPFVSKDEIFDTFKKAISLHSLNTDTEDDAQNKVTTYGCIYSDNYDFSDDFKAFYTLYSNTKKDITSPETLDITFLKTCAMAKMQNGTKTKTVEQVMDCIEKNAAVILADLSYMEDEDVSLSQVAALVNSDYIYQYYKDPNWFKTLVDSVEEEDGTDEVIGGSTGGGSSGGGGGGSFGGGRPNRGDVSIGTEKPDGTENGKQDDVITPTEEGPFKDIASFDWAKEAILYLEEADVISGTGDGTFEPGRNITREEFVKIVCGAFQVKIAQGEEKMFTDVDTNAWYYPYMKIASSNGIVNGISETTFGVGQNITRQDMAVILLNVMTYKEKSVIAYSAGYTDEETIPAYAKDAVNVMSKIGVITGFPDGSFGGKNYATRAQAAVMIYRLLNYLN